MVDTLSIARETTKSAHAVEYAGGGGVPCSPEHLGHPPCSDVRDRSWDSSPGLKVSRGGLSPCHE